MFSLWKLTHTHTQNIKNIIFILLIMVREKENVCKNIKK